MARQKIHLCCWLVLFLIGAFALVEARGVSPAVQAQDGDDLDRLDRAVKRLARKLSPSVVSIRVVVVGPVEEEQSSGTTGVGTAQSRREIYRASGVVWSSDEQILTVMSDGMPGRSKDGGGYPNHDLELSEKLIYEVESGDGQWSLARWDGFDPETGVTLLTLEDSITGLKAAKFAQRAPDRWSTVVSVGSDGFALGQVVHPARGIENRRRPGSTFPRGIITTIEAQPGDVGGILANSSGELVGMLAFTLLSSESGEKPDTGYDAGGEPRRSREGGSMAAGKGGWLDEVRQPPLDRDEVGVAVVTPLREGMPLGRVVAIPADLLARIARDLKRWGRVQRGALGATFRFHHPSRSSHNHYGVGAMVLELVSEGTAIESGLEVGDLVQKIDARVLASPKDLLWFRERVEYGQIGESLTLSVARMEQRRVVTKTNRIPIGKRPGESAEEEASESSAERERGES